MIMRLRSCFNGSKKELGWLIIEFALSVFCFVIITDNWIYSILAVPVLIYGLIFNRKMYDLKQKIKFGYRAVAVIYLLAVTFFLLKTHFALNI